MSNNNNNSNSSVAIRINGKTIYNPSDEEYSKIIDFIEKSSITSCEEEQELEWLPTRLGKWSVGRYDFYKIDEHGKIVKMRPNILDVIFPKNSSLEGFNILFRSIAEDELNNNENNIIEKSLEIKTLDSKKVLFKLIDYVNLNVKFFVQKLYNDFNINKALIKYVISTISNEPQIIIDKLYKHYNLSLDDLKSKINLNFSYINLLINNNDKKELYNYVSPLIEGVINKDISEIWLYDVDVEEYGLYKEDEGHDNEIRTNESKSKEIQFYKNRINELEKEKANLLNSIDKIIEEKLAKKLNDMVEVETVVVEEKVEEKENNTKTTKKDFSPLNNSYTLNNEVKKMEAFSDDPSKMSVFNIQLRFEHVKDDIWKDKKTGIEYTVPTKFNSKKNKHVLDNNAKAQLIKMILKDVEKNSKSN